MITMNFIERIKYKKNVEYLDYKKALEANKLDITRFNEYSIDSQLKLNNLLKQRSSDINEINRLKEEIKKWNYEYEKSILITEFIRPNTKEEIESRNIIGNTFANNLKSILGSNSNLRFHGTPIYFAKEIIKSNSITSTADRYNGYIASSDESGVISASTIDSLSRTIDYFTDFSSYMRCLPCGVLFVLNEKEGDFELRNTSEMQNINFKTNPEQLVGIVCTDEVKKTVIKWCVKYNMDENKVFSYNEFLEYAKDNKLENNKTR